MELKNLWQSSRQAFSFNMRFTFILFYACILLFTSCKKDKNPNSNSSTVKTTYFKLKKDGVSYNANFLNAVDVQDNTISFEAYTSLTEFTNNTYFGIIRKDISPGTYTFIESENDDFSLYHYRDENSIYGLGTGQLTVISNDSVSKTIHATFELSLYNDELDEYPSITDGEFVIQY